MISQTVLNGIIDSARQAVDEFGRVHVWRVNTEPEEHVWLTLDDYTKHPDDVELVWSTKSRGEPIGRPLRESLQK